VIGNGDGDPFSFSIIANSGAQCCAIESILQTWVPMFRANMIAPKVRNSEPVTFAGICPWNQVWNRARSYPDIVGYSELF